VCTLCPAQCNVTVTVRDERARRILQRDNAEVDDGWLCDKGRFGYQSFHVDERVTQPLVRDGGALRPVSWERALAEASACLERAGAQTGAIAAGGATNEEGHLLARLMREGLGSPHLDSRRAGALPLDLHRALGEPRLQAKVADLEFAHAVLVLDAEPVNDAPILDLRLRKGVRRHGLKLAVASPHKSLLDANAALSVRYAPGAGAAFAAALAAALSGTADAEQLARDAGAEPDAVSELATLLSGADASGEDAGSEETAPREVVVLWGERLTAGPVGAAGARALLGLADGLGVAGVDGAGLLEVPAFANGRGLREAGVLPNAGPGLAEPGPVTATASGNGNGHGTATPPARDAHEIAAGLAAGDLSALYLLHCDPLRDLADRELWERALAGASSVIAHASFLTEGIREHANVVFPAEVYAEKEGTIVHPDGRLQRLRPAIAHAGDVRAEWRVIAELALRIGLDLDVLSGTMASQRLFDAVPFYAGLELEEIGGRGVRWQERDAAAAFPAADAAVASGAGSARADEGAKPSLRAEPGVTLEPGPDGADFAGWRSVWDAPEVEYSPALEFLFPRENPVLPLSYSGGGKT
jgi:NADH-quinone oxidoreductase subunit G